MGMTRWHSANTYQPKKNNIQTSYWPVIEFPAPVVAIRWDACASVAQVTDCNAWGQERQQSKKSGRTVPGLFTRGSATH